MVTNGRLWLDKRLVVVYLFFALPLASTLWSRYPDETLWYGSLVLVNIGIFHLASKANTHSMDQLISSLVIIVPLVMAFTFVLIYYKYGTVRADSAAIKDEIKSISNAGPALVVLCVPYLLAFQSLAFKKSQVWFALVACFIVVLLSQSRGGLLMAVIALFLSLYFYPGSINARLLKILKWGGASLAILVVVLFFVGYERAIAPVIERFEQSQLFAGEGLTSPSKDAGGDFGRALMYSEGINAIYQEPISGIGYYSLMRFMEERNSIGFGTVSHNLIITAWGEMGLAGLFVLIWLVWSIMNGLRRCLKSDGLTHREKLLASATLVAFLVAIAHAQFRPLFSNLMFPIILAQAYTMIRLARKRKSMVNKKPSMACL